MISSKMLEALVLGLGLCALACGDDQGSRGGNATNESTETGNGSGDAIGDGDGDVEGDGDGDPGDGDGDDGTGDGDGVPGGDGDGDRGPGDGDGDGNAEGLCAGPCGSLDCGECPGAPVVDADFFFIDATEVTVADYAEFAALQFHPVVLSQDCLWKMDSGWFTPDDWNQQLADNPLLPVRGVDWCDAEAYCGWAGKRLCGLVGGGPAQLEEFSQPPNEWYRACSDGGVKNYPYGNGYQKFACNGFELGIDALMPGGSMPDCEGGLEGLFDMSGNLWEWTNSCGDDPDAEDWTQECRRRGGSYYSTKELLRCTVDSTRHRGYRDTSTGIRCCSD